MFTFLHLTLIGFNLFGWIWKPTRKLHLLTAFLTLFSWFILGIWYGWGYCPLTDWHWDVKKQLGEKLLPASFVKYLADKVTGLDISPRLVDNMTLWLFIAAIVCSLYFNFLHKKK